MYKSQFFIPTLREMPSDATIMSHQLMLRSGMIRQVSAGIYNWLPLGYKVLKKIENIVRRNMDNIAMELLMPCIQPAELWIESGRYNDYGAEMLRFLDRHKREILFGPTHEEVMSDLFRKTVNSYKQLPMMFYQIQWKFRDEIRPRFGVLRGREFYMKDAYSFDIDQASAEVTYHKVFKCYVKLFQDLGVVAIPLRADSGPIGGKLNHEFHIVADTGESKIYYEKRATSLKDSEELQNIYAVTEEKYDPSTCPIAADQLIETRGIEVGHIFYFGTKYSGPMKLNLVNKAGESSPIHMGAYGIGVSRLVGALIEAYHDEHGMKLPPQVAPFDVSIIKVKTQDTETNKVCDELYTSLRNNNIDVLYDDEEQSIGSKFATHDLIGIPHQLIIGPNEAKNGMVEYKNRSNNQKQQMSIEAALNKLLNDKV